MREYLNFSKNNSPRLLYGVPDDLPPLTFIFDNGIDSPQNFEDVTNLLGSTDGLFFYWKEKLIMTSYVHCGILLLGR